MKARHLQKSFGIKSCLSPFQINRPEGFLCIEIAPRKSVKRRSPLERLLKINNIEKSKNNQFNQKIKKMSLKTFINKIWGDVKTLFESFPDEMKTAIHIGVLITENIKNFVDSPVADVLGALIPDDIGEDIKAWLRAKIPGILTELKLADSCSGLTDPQQITACAIKVLQGLDGDIQSAFLHNLSIFIAQVASNGQLTWSDGVSILEWYYQNEYKVAA
jgi:hypothetical protein